MARTAPVYASLLSRIEADLAQTHRVLDVATGTGSLALRLADGQRRVDAVDLAPGMLDQARAKAEAAGTRGIEWHHASAYRLPFEAGSFDGVTCVNALHVMEHPERALAEIRRVCRPGGTLVIPTFCHNQTLRARIASRLMVLFGFRVYTRYTQLSLSTQVTTAGFNLLTTEKLDGLFPLVYLACRRE